MPSARLQGFDYGVNAAYFVTICTQNRQHYFGAISPVETDNYPSLLTDNNNTETGNCPSLRYAPIGLIALEYWLQIPQHFPFVILDEFVIMPNHIHSILFFDKPDKTDWTPNQFGSQSQNLPSVIRAYKASVKRYANQNNIEFGWQSRYWDRVIRDKQELNVVRNYIVNNPVNWKNDKFYNS